MKKLLWFLLLPSLLFGGKEHSPWKGWELIYFPDLSLQDLGATDSTFPHITGDIKGDSAWFNWLYVRNLWDTTKIKDTLGAYFDTLQIKDTLGAYWDTLHQYFSQDSINWDTLGLGAYPDTTITNALRDSLGAYWDTTNHFSNFGQDSIVWDTLGIYLLKADTNYTDSSDVAGWNYFNSWDTLSIYFLIADTNYTDSADVNTWNYFNTESELTILLNDNYEVQLNNEAGLYAVLSDVSDFVQPGELDYTDSSDVDGWNFFNKESELTALLDDNYEVQLNNEAGLYAVLSDITDFVQPGELDYTDSSDVSGWGYFLATDTNYTDSSDVADWNYINDLDTLDSYLLKADTNYTDSSDVDGWGFMDDTDVDSIVVSGDYLYIYEDGLRDSADISMGADTDVDSVKYITGDTLVVYEDDKARKVKITRVIDSDTAGVAKDLQAVSSVVSNAEVDDDLTISASGSVDTSAIGDLATFVANHDVDAYTKAEARGVIHDTADVVRGEIRDTATVVWNDSSATLAALWQSDINDTGNVIRGEIRDTATVVWNDSLPIIKGLISDTADIVRSEIRDTATVVWNDSLSVVKGLISDTADVVRGEIRDTATVIWNDSSATLAALYQSDISDSCDVVRGEIRDTATVVWVDSASVMRTYAQTIAGDSVDVARGEMRDSATVVWNDSSSTLAALYEGVAGDSLDVGRAEMRDTATIVWNDSSSTLAALYQGVAGDTADVIRGEIRDTATIVWNDSSATLAALYQAVAGDTADVLRAEMGDTAEAHLDTLSRSFVIQAIDTDHDFAFWMTREAITLVKVSGVCNGGTNVVGCLMEYDANAANPVVCNSSDWTFTTGEEETTSLSNANIDAGDYLGWKTASVSGEVSFFTLTFEYIK